MLDGSLLPLESGKGSGPVGPFSSPVWAAAGAGRQGGRLWHRAAAVRRPPPLQSCGSCPGRRSASGTGGGAAEGGEARPPPPSRPPETSQNETWAQSTDGGGLNAQGGNNHLEQTSCRSRNYLDLDRYLIYILILIFDINGPIFYILHEETVNRVNNHIKGMIFTLTNLCLVIGSWSEV